MRRTHQYVYFVLLAAVFLLNACREDNIIEPNGIKINFQAVTGLKSSADTMVIEEAFIGIESIDLIREGEADSATVEKIVYEGPYTVNLLKGTVSPAIRWIFAEPGYYREIKVTTSSSLSQGNSIILKGTMFPADGKEEIPFEMYSSGNHTLTIKNNTGITISEGENVDLLVVFDLSDLFSEVDLNSFDRNEQGVVVLSEDMGISAVTSMVNAFEAFSSFGLNDGLPFPGGENVTPGNDTPGEVETPEEGEEDDSGQEGNEEDPDDENPDDENENEDDAPGGGTDDEQDEDSSGDESEDNDNNDGGSTEDDDDSDAGDEGDENSENDNNGDESDEDSENGQDDQNDDGESTDGDESGNDSQNDDGDEGDDDDGEDDGSADDNEDDSSGQDNENKGKGNNSGKGNDKNKDKGNKGKGKK